MQPVGKRNEALGIIRQGLADISISRTSIDWGVPVPWDPDHVFYVWVDALINYATAVGYGADPELFHRWWPGVHHVIGKDILRFHCVYWPAMLLAAGLEPPHRINVHGFLLVGGEKMSKTGLNQIYPADLVADFGVDGFRYQFLRDTPFGPDGDFSYEGMVARYNSDLANNLGNLLARVATVVAKKCDGVGPAPRATAPSRPSRPSATPTRPRPGRPCSPPSRSTPPGGCCARPNQVLEANEPWKSDPGPEAMRCWAMPSRRCASCRCWPRRPCPAPAPRCGGASAWTARRPTSGCRGGRLGRLPGGLPVEKGDSLFPRIEAAD